MSQPLGPFECATAHRVVPRPWCTGDIIRVTSSGPVAVARQCGLGLRPHDLERLSTYALVTMSLSRSDWYLLDEFQDSQGQSMYNGHRTRRSRGLITGSGTPQGCVSWPSRPLSSHAPKDT